MNRTAICTYVDNDSNLVEEFGWLHRSWLVSGSNETSDIVAFHHPEINLPELDGVKYVPIVPISETNPMWGGYPFINSVWYLTTPEASNIFWEYEYILRTDNDCFLTENFNSLKPRLPTFGVGLFAGEPIVVAMLAQIAEKWGLKMPFNNVGSTMMAKTSDVLQYSQVQMQFCERLMESEFPEGPGRWPDWFQGVTTMYAGQLAAASHFGSNMIMGGLDVQCMSHDQICNTDYHIHAFHTNDHFSKFKWREGSYKDTPILDKNSIAEYWLWVARGAE